MLRDADEFQYTLPPTLGLWGWHWFACGRWLGAGARFQVAGQRTQPHSEGNQPAGQRPVVQPSASDRKMDIEIEIP
jgi:hypothetical protein